MKILVPTSGKEAARDIANYVIDVANRLDADVIALHIMREGESRADGQRCCDVLCRAGEKAGVTVVVCIKDGSVVQVINSVAVEANVDLILMGASRGKLVEDWLSNDVMATCEIPVLVVPHCYQG